MSENRFAPLVRHVEGAVRDGLLPGAVLVVGRSERVLLERAIGWRAVRPRREPMTTRTIFDLASLTKVLVTAPIAVETANAGGLSLHDPLERHLEETRGTEVGRIPLHRLLTHTAGFVPDNPLRDYRRGKRALIEAIAREPLEAKPGTRLVYSDVGYVLLQVALERRAGRRLDRLASASIFEPLGFRDTRFGTLPRDRGRVAPTTIERGRILRGRVQDPRARSRALGGVAGHAGVFGTAPEVARFAAMILNGGRDGTRRILAAETVRGMSTNQCETAIGARRGFGFDIESPYSAPRGGLFSSRSFGHTGWTGVSLWIDPEAAAYFVLLANSVHPDGHRDLKAFRHEAGTLAARGLRTRST